MKDGKPTREWGTIRVPVELLEMVRNFIEDCPEWGYTSVPEFVKEAIRCHLQYYIGLNLPDEEEHVKEEV